MFKIKSIFQSNFQKKELNEKKKGGVLEKGFKKKRFNNQRELTDSYHFIKVNRKYMFFQDRNLMIKVKTSSVVLFL